MYPGLGVFGFTALYSLQAEDLHNSTGNAALQDQTAAMQWTHDNIANFGGDPNRVHIFGESAGGFSIAWHLVSPAGAGLFQSATMESGSSDTTQFFAPLADAVSFTELYAATCGCNVTSVPSMGSNDPLLVCLRALSTDDLMKSLVDVLNPNWPLPALAESVAPSSVEDLYSRLGFPKEISPPNLLPRKRDLDAMHRDPVIPKFCPLSSF